MKAFRRVEDYFLARFDPAGVFFFRARLLVQFELFSALMAVGYFANSFYTGFLATRYLMVGVFLVFGAQLFALRLGFSRHAVAHSFVIVCWSVLVFLAQCSGGIRSPVLPWITWVPVLALLLMGRKVGWSWGVVGLISILFFYFTDGMVSVPPSWATQPDPLLNTSLYIGLLAMVLFVTSVFHILGKRMLKTIRGQKEIIELQHTEIATRAATLEAEVERRTKELLDYNQQLEQFAFIASHNLRAPVASLLGLGHLLDVKQLSEPDREQISRNMITTARELDRVVRDLSTILEMRKSSHELLSQVNLDEELGLIRVSLERELSETDAVVESDFAEVPVVETVRPLLDSILMNLISNGIKYRDPERPPQIVLRTARVNGEICLSVTDNGLGMDLEAYGDKLFTLYGRFHSHVDGKGLGLYLVKAHVQAMGGRIEVESEPGRGTTFRVFLKD